MTRIIPMAVITLGLALTIGTGPTRAQGPGGPMAAERKIVAQFDKDGDKRLNAEERKAARAFLATQPNTGPGGGREGGRGGGREGGRPGRGGGMPPGGMPPGGMPGGMPPGGMPPGGGMPGGGMGGGRGMAAASPGLKVSPADVTPTPAATPLYDLKTLRTLFLTFDDGDWEAELAAFNNTDVEVPATLVVDGKTYKDVGIHFRGASSYFSVPAGSKRSLNVSMDFVQGDQTLLGYKTLNLLNSNGDPTLMRAVLYQQIARNYLPAGHANFVRVVINGELWGVYASTQQFNKEWLRDHFSTTDGARWKVPGSPGGRAGLEYLGDDPAAYKRLYEIKSKDTPEAWASFIHMTKVLNQTPPDQLEAALSPLLDIDVALKFLALEVALVNSDGYWTRASDYNIYQDPKGRFHILPHDTNETFHTGGGRGGGPGGPGGPGGRGGRMGPDGLVGPVGPGGPGGGRGGGMAEGGVTLDIFAGANDPSKPLLSKLLAVPALKARYAGYVKNIAERWLDWKTLGPIVAAHRALIEAEVLRDTKKLSTNEAFGAGLEGTAASLKSFAEQRRAFLLR